MGLVTFFPISYSNLQIDLQSNPKFELLANPVTCFATRPNWRKSLATIQGNTAFLWRRGGRGRAIRVAIEQVVTCRWTLLARLVTGLRRSIHCNESPGGNLKRRAATVLLTLTWQIRRTTITRSVSGFVDAYSSHVACCFELQRNMACLVVATVRNAGSRSYVKIASPFAFAYPFSAVA